MDGHLDKEWAGERLGQGGVERLLYFTADSNVAKLRAFLNFCFINEVKIDEFSMQTKNY